MRRWFGVLVVTSALVAEVQAVLINPDFEISGSAVPEPAAVLLFGVGATVVSRRRALVGHRSSQ